MKYPTILPFAALLAYAVDASPTLTPGAWTNITPASIAGKMVNLVTVDPGNPSTIYLTGSHGDKLGLIKSSDGGSTWARIGNPPATPNYGDTVDYLDAPFKVRIDPADSKHMYATEMSPGGSVTQGFWVTHNGGATWVRTKGFMDAVKSAKATTDVGHYDVDPTDFNHVIVSFHYYWDGDGPSGIFETKDGGNTFIVHPPGPGMVTASKSVAFLYEPNLKIGSKDTWLVVEDMTSMYITRDAGATWKIVWDKGSPHGGVIGHCWTKGGVFYTGGYQAPMRSSDAGATWEQVPGSPYSYFSDVACDGNNLYISGQAADWAWFTSPEIDAAHWTKSAITPSFGASEIIFDPINRIIYSANNTAGIWALKVDDAQAIKPGRHSAAGKTAAPKNALQIAIPHVILENAAGESFDAKGKSFKIEMKK
jgi:photosystem II stability/assembly factor-like uncharacterized protein